MLYNNKNLQDPWTLSCARTNLTFIDLENFRATFAFIEEDVFISDWDVGFSSSGRIFVSDCMLYL